MTILSPTFGTLLVALFALRVLGLDCFNCAYELCDSNEQCLYGCKLGYCGRKCADLCEMRGCKPSEECYRLLVFINGRKRYDCSLCPKGYYRGNTTETFSCLNKCPSNCMSCSESNYCDECIAPFYNIGEYRDCSRKCPYKCATCLSSTNCTKCIPPYSNNGGVTDCSSWTCPENCKTCLWEKCSSCINGHFNESNSCNDICSVNCLTCSSRGKCEACIADHYNGYEMDDPKRSFAENCQWACRQNCVECMGYNQCQKCVNGTFGSVCKKQCSVGCKFDVCEKETGSCDCKQSFSGDKCCLHSPHCRICSSPTECAECEEGHYGKLCQHNCSTSCHGGCDMASGKCRSCATNTYGRFCDQNCSSGCFVDSSGSSLCNVTNGICLHGCNTGYFGANCESSCSVTCLNGCDTKSGLCKGCLANMYGLFCNNSCSENCFDDAEGATKCNATNGSCLQGCMYGYYGEMCTSPCSKYCVGRICDRILGECLLGCTDAQNGPMCGESASSIEQENDNNSVDQIGVAVGITFALTTLFTAAVILVILRFKSRLKTMCTKGSGVTEDVTEIKSDACETYETLEADRTISNVDYEILEAKRTKSYRNTKV